MNLGNKTKECNVGLYIRLSREDDDKVLESESITNQKSLLTQYVSENGFNLIDIYVDDGYTGTNFERPDFKRMIEDIERGRINTVITKDMSRLGRDYIGTGNLIEKWFPEHGIRYIAVTDNVDTSVDCTNNDIAPFKAIMNDMYAKDISKKIRSSLIEKRKKGEYISSRPPYGYKLDPENKKHLIVDEEKGEIVRRIYEMALNGKTTYIIAKTLTNEHIKTPSDYYPFKWLGKERVRGKWNSKTIEDILSNGIYCGDMVQYRRKKINYKVKKVVKNDPTQYIIVPNTHEALVSHEDFKEVSKMLPKNVGRNEKKEYHLFDGLLYCGDCHHRISVTPRRKKDNNCYTVCNYHRTYYNLNVCSGHCNNYDKLETILINEVKEKLEKYIDKKKIKKAMEEKEFKKNSDTLENRIDKLKKEVDASQNKMDELYLDKLNKTIDDEMFLRMKRIIDVEIETKKKMINELVCKQEGKKRNIDYQKEIDKFVDDFLSLEKPNRELIVALIDKIEIFEDKTINITFAFKENM